VEDIRFEHVGGKRHASSEYSVFTPCSFGTDEFIDWCRATKIEPFICLNMGTGTLEEALAWVEYCNGTGDSEWVAVMDLTYG